MTLTDRVGPLGPGRLSLPILVPVALVLGRGRRRRRGQRQDVDGVQPVQAGQVVRALGRNIKVTSIMAHLGRGRSGGRARAGRGPGRGPRPHGANDGAPRTGRHGPKGGAAEPKGQPSRRGGRAPLRCLTFESIPVPGGARCTLQYPGE